MTAHKQPGVRAGMTQRVVQRMQAVNGGVSAVALQAAGDDMQAVCVGQRGAVRVLSLSSSAQVGCSGWPGPAGRRAGKACWTVCRQSAGSSSVPRVTQSLTYSA